MTERQVDCVFLREKAPGFASPPYPGELGQRIFESVSVTAWQQWLAQQTMLINENRLTPVDPEHRAWLEAQMQAFLFDGKTDKPAGYVPPDAA